MMKLRERTKKKAYQRKHDDNPVLQMRDKDIVEKRCQQGSKKQKPKEKNGKTVEEGGAKISCCLF
jgi:hypothetical protein